MFIDSVKRTPPTRVQGTAVFMFRNPDGTPTALLHNLKHNRVLHERVILLTVVSEELPFVEPEDRFRITDLGEGLFQMEVHYGFSEDSDIPEVLSAVQEPFKVDPMQVSFFLGRETLIATKKNPGMAIWRERLFAWMTNNARSAASFFRLPPNRVVELGAQIEL
jgi:KUP system potassium uptake protein